MDRNIWREVLELVQRQSLSARRAWIEMRFRSYSQCSYWSLSARRAWIEISIMQIKTVTGCVALRKESVDRNQRIAKPFREQFKSLSARRAWIEMIMETPWLYLI